METEVNLEEMLGQVIDGDILESLIASGRVKFNYENVDRPSAFSKGGDDVGCDLDEKNDGRSKKDDDKDKLQGLIDSVKENEDWIKTLEDIRDDMLKDMSISPKNDKIKQAAIQLGSDDGTITKDVFDVAETIIDDTMQGILNQGYVPQLAAIDGLGKFGVPKGIDCQDIKKDIYDRIQENLDILNKSKDELSPQDRTLNDIIADSDQHFKDQMHDLFIYLINELFWNYVWGKIWIAIFDLVEKIIARPIDTIVIFVKSLFTKKPHYKTSLENFYKYGWIHPLLNKLRLLFLCRIPKWAWPPYEPDDNIVVYYSEDGKNYRIYSLKTICSEYADSECAKEFEDEELDSEFWNDVTNNKDKTVNASDLGIDNSETSEVNDTEDFNNKIGEAMEQALDPSKSKVCQQKSIKLLFSKLRDNPGLSHHKCTEAAKTILEAVYNDALYGEDINS